jgi:hypothetical protein
MGNPAFNVIVVLFWLATMSWLVVAKIIPPLRIGEPPTYSTIVEESTSEPPACWAIRMKGRTIGWAANAVVRQPEGISSFYSRVYLAELPLDELAPAWVSTILRPVFPNLNLVDLDKQSWFSVDPLGRLSDFESRVRLAGIPDAIRVSGTVEGSNLKLMVRSGEISAPIHTRLAPNSLMNDELSPQSRMPNLRVGQTWTVPLYSPFRAPHNPLDILQATVESEERIRWGDEAVPARLIVYRGDPGNIHASDQVRGRMWVRTDGLVLRQEVAVFKTPVQFDRVADQQAERMRELLPEDWKQSMPPRAAAAALAILRGTAVSEDSAEASPLPGHSPSPEPQAAP